MTASSALSRRRFLQFSGLAMASGLAGCTSSMDTDRFRRETAPYFRNPAIEGRPEMLQGDYRGRARTGLLADSSYYASIYAERTDGGYRIPAVPYQQIDPRYYRQEVESPFAEPPGTIIVDTGNRFLYLILSNGRAMRYGVGIGRDGFSWSGRGVIQWKQAWPRWTPPDSMIARQPELARYSADNGGMAPGLNNPLGARALYIFQNGQDTLYRLHGTPEWQSIGRAVSSGCVRLLNQDIIDLYDRIRGKAPILVI